MKGQELFDAIRSKIKKESNQELVSDGEIASKLGIQQSRLSQLKTRQLTAMQVASIITKARMIGHKEAEKGAIQPIVEFLRLHKTRSQQNARWELFSIGSAANVNSYLKGLRENLRSAKGIYVFHDSRGRALYTGKTLQLTLWTEMNNAFNRAREVQSVRLVAHPTRKKTFSEDDGTRRIQPTVLHLHDLATYVSAYRVADGLISRFEAILIRSFANDLLNVKMEAL